MPETPGTTSSAEIPWQTRKPTSPAKRLQQSVRRYPISNLLRPHSGAGNCKLTVRNRDTGEAYIDEEVGGNYGAFYYTNGQSWQNTQLGLNLSWAGTDSQGKPLPDGTPVEISLSCARNTTAMQTLHRWDDLGRGAAFTTQLTIDNTAPQITDISLSLTGNRALSIRAKDNQYVAAVTLMNASGTKVLETVVPNQTEAAAEIAATLRLDSYTGNKFLVLYTTTP